MTTQNPNTENQDTTTDLRQQFETAQARFRTAWADATFPIDEAIIGEEAYVTLMMGACVYLGATTRDAGLYAAAYFPLAEDAEDKPFLNDYIATLNLAAEAISEAALGVEE